MRLMRDFGVGAFLSFKYVYMYSTNSIYNTCTWEQMVLKLSETYTCKMYLFSVHSSTFFSLLNIHVSKYESKISQ